jgi:hypothetical protein
MGGFLASVVVVLLQYLHLEITVTDDYQSQYNGFVLLGVIFYTPCTIVLGILLAIGLQFTKLKTLRFRNLLLIIFGICSLAILVYVQISTSIYKSSIGNDTNGKQIILDYDEAQRQSN